MEMLPTPNLLEPHNLMVIQVRETHHHHLQMEEEAGVGVEGEGVADIQVLDLRPLICLREPHHHHHHQEEVEPPLPPLRAQVLLQDLQYLYQFKDHGKDH